MKHFIFILLVLSTAVLTGSPAQADYFPPECVPAPSLSVWGDGHSEGSVSYNPGLSTHCEPWNGSAYTLDNPAEVAWIQYNVEHEYRIGQTTSWDTEIIATNFVGSVNLNGLISGQPNYLLQGAMVIFPGATSTHHRYRLVVELAGDYSDSPSAPYNIQGTFIDTFYSPWVDYVVDYEVNPTFDDRADDLVAPGRRTAPIGGNLRGN